MMIEFALSIVVLLTVVFGIMVMCMSLFTFFSLSESAREGSRYAMVHGATCSISGTSCTATAAQIQTYVRSLGFPGINPAKLTVTVSYAAYPSGGSCTPNANCTNPGNAVTVKVIYPFPMKIPFITASTLNMTSTSARVISQ